MPTSMRLAVRRQRIMMAESDGLLFHERESVFVSSNQRRATQSDNERCSSLQ